MKKEKSNLKVGFVTELDPNDKRSWSGIHYSMSQALKRQFSDVISLGPVKLDLFSSFWVNLSVFLFKIFHIIVYKRKVRSIHFPVKSKAYGRFFMKRIKDTGIDVVFAPVASIEIAYLRTHVPICYFSDTTFGQIWGYYNFKTDLSPTMWKKGNKIEKLAIKNSTTQVFSSKWAADYARDHYASRNTFVTKMGANLDINFNALPIEKDGKSEFNLLFIGVEWERKGGPIVFETFNELLNKGFSVTLTVCGCIPPVKHPKMTVIPFLDKNKEEDMQEIKRLYSKADLFFMPTRAETYGIVYCEANAFGLPVIATDTGGVSTIVEDGVNGFLLPESARSAEYAELLERLINDTELYENMSRHARQKYETDLNWKAWGRRMSDILIETKLLS